MTRRYGAVAAVAALLILPSTASMARTPAANACFHDVNARCGRVGSGVAGVERCVRTHFSQFSTACQALLTKAKPVTAACRADFESFCANRGSFRRLALCVHSNSARFSERCRGAYSRVAAHLR